MTWEHNSPGDIIISSDSYVLREYCMNTNSNWQCIEWLRVVPYESLQTQYQAQSEWNSNVLAFAWIIVLFIRLIKWIFRLIIPWKWKK